MHRLLAVAALIGFCFCCVAQTGSHPAAADVALSEGVQALRNNDPVAAVAAFETLTRLRPQFAEGYLNLGLALEQVQDYRRAVAALSKAVSLKPTVHGGNLFLGIAQYQLNDYAKAEKALRLAVKQAPKDPKTLMWLGIDQIALDQNDAAAATLDAAAALAPNDIDILYHRGRAHLLVSKASYAAMFALAPESYRVHEVLGQADAEADRTSDAIGEYKLAIERAPRQTGLHEELGDLYWVDGKMDLADAAYLQELAVDKNSITTLYKLGSLRVIVGKPQDAIPYLKQTIAQDPSFENAYYYLGRAQADTGQYDQGIANLQHATVAPNDDTLNSLAYYQLSRVYRRLRRTDEANIALAEFRRLRDAKDRQQQEKRNEKINRRSQLPKEEQVPSIADPAQ